MCKISLTLNMSNSKWDSHSNDKKRKHESGHHQPFLSAHRLKSKSGIETLPSSSGAFLCLLESGEPLAFWFSTPNRVRLSTDSSGRTATAMGKLILRQTRTVLAEWRDSTNSMLLLGICQMRRGRKGKRPRQSLTVHPI